ESRDQALFERLFAERRRDLRARDQRQLDRERSRLQLVREVLRRGDREATRDLRARRGVDPFRVLGVVDRGNRDQLAVEHDREVLLSALLVDPRKLGFLATAGNFLGDPLKDALALCGETEV